MKTESMSKAVLPLSAYCAFVPLELGESIAASPINIPLLLLTRVIKTRSPLYNVAEHQIFCSQQRSSVGKTSRRKQWKMEESNDYSEGVYNFFEAFHDARRRRKEMFSFPARLFIASTEIREN